MCDLFVGIIINRAAMASSAAETPCSGIYLLPDDVITNCVFPMLDVLESVQLATACSRLHHLASNPNTTHPVIRSVCSLLTLMHTTTDAIAAKCQLQRLHRLLWLRDTLFAAASAVPDSADSVFMPALRRLSDRFFEIWVTQYSGNNHRSPVRVPLASLKLSEFLLSRWNKLHPVTDAYARRAPSAMRLNVEGALTTSREPYVLVPISYSDVTLNEPDLHAALDRLHYPVVNCATVGTMHVRHPRWEFACRVVDSLAAPTLPKPTGTAVYALLNHVFLCCQTRDSRYEQRLQDAALAYNRERVAALRGDGH
jgi:hypothetical protein